MTAALEGGEWSAARSGRISPLGKTRAWVGPRAGLDGPKISPQLKYLFTFNGNNINHEGYAVHNDITSVSTQIQAEVFSLSSVIKYARLS